MARFSSLLLGLSTVAAHNRLVCPPPRSGQTGAKDGPCDVTDDNSQAAFELTPGLNTIYWEESISHPGAPARFALSSGPGDEFEQCLLLDHVPHDERADVLLPNTMDPPTENCHQYSITLWIPDIACERCTLQLVTFMTDEIHDLPVNETCAYEPAQRAGTANPNLRPCGVVYHSCAPVKITGSTPAEDYVCDLSFFEEQLRWPFAQNKEPSTYYYKGDPGLYDRTDPSTPNRPVLQSAGSPVVGCSSFFYCDPDEYYRSIFEVPTGASYTQPQGTCAARSNDEQPTLERA